MKKKEFKVGEVFQCGLIKLKCIESGSNCNNCYFGEMCKLEVVGNCSDANREDKTNVIFVKVEDLL